MPEFKISGELEKMAREVLRIQITVLGDCPQCSGGEYISGVCEDCGYIAPEVLEAIQEWQMSQGMEPQQQAKAASREIVDAFSQIIVMAKDKKKKDNECPRCGGVLEDGISCRNCTYERPPSELNHKTPEYTGISPDLLKDVRRRFVPSTNALEKINEQKKKKHKKNKEHGKTKKSSFRADNVTLSKTKGNSIEGPPPGQGSDDEVAADDATSKMHNMLLTDAQITTELNAGQQQQQQGAIDESF